MKRATTTFAVLFYLKKQKTSLKGKAPLCARVTVNGKRCEISLKHSLHVNEWNEMKGMAKGNRKEITELNLFLTQFKAKIINTYQTMLLNDEPIDGPTIRDKVMGTDRLAPTLALLMEYHNE